MAGVGDPPTQAPALSRARRLLCSMRPSSRKVAGPMSSRASRISPSLPRIPPPGSRCAPWMFLGAFPGPC